MFLTKGRTSQGLLHLHITQPFSSVARP